MNDRLDLGLTHAPDAAGVWLPLAVRAPYEYSEFFDDTEDKLLTLIERATDRSLASAELATGITDFATRYHLSPERANLLRPLHGLLAGKRVLELGAGCGAITRYLGEIDAEVMAVEGSRRRAGIVAARCADLPNIVTVCDRIEDFLAALPFGQTFDAVLLVGVLEYAPRYLDGPDPVAALLRLVAARVAPGGAAIVAIENQLGLKYFAGAPEDHLGVPMQGLQDGYGSRDVVTFGRQELSEKLAATGLGTVEAWLPLPDYKLPTTVLTPALAGTPLSTFDPTALVRLAFQSDAQRSAAPLFSVEQALGPIVRNGLLAEVANSLLLVARRDAAATTNILAHHYSARRRPAYCKATCFVRDGNSVTVQRVPLYPAAAAPDPSQLQHRLADEAYRPGTLWSDALGVILTRPQWTIAQVVAWAARWDAAVRATVAVDADGLLPGAALDLLPQNLVVAADGGASFIDREWTTTAPVPRGYLLFRGLVNSLFAPTAVAMPADARHLTAGPLLDDVLRALGEAATPVQLQAWAVRERALATAVTGPRLPLDYQTQIADRPFPLLLDLADRAALGSRLADQAAALTAAQVARHAAEDARQQSAVLADLHGQTAAALETQLNAQRHATADLRQQLEQAATAQQADRAAQEMALGAARHAAADLQQQLDQANQIHAEAIATLEGTLGAQLHAATDARQQFETAASTRLQKIQALEEMLATEGAAAAGMAQQHEAIVTARVSQQTAQLTAQLTAVEAAAAISAQRLRQATADAAIQAAQHERLQSDAAASQARLVAFQAGLETLQAEGEAQHARAKLLDAALASAREEIATLDGRLTVQTRQYETLQEAHALVDAARVDAELRVTALLDARAQLAQTLSDERAARAATQRMLDVREKRLAALLHSTSWRVTGPLRRGSALLRSLAVRLRPTPTIAAAEVPAVPCAPGSIRYSIDYLNIKDDRLYMFGWAFHDGPPIVAVELRVSEDDATVVFEGTYATTRPDVVEALGNPAAAPSGFRLGCKLPAARAEGATLRFRVEDGRVADYAVSTAMRQAAPPIRRHRLRRGLQLARRGQVLSLVKKSLAVARRRRAPADGTQADFGTLVAAICSGRPVAVPLDHQAAAFLRQLADWQAAGTPLTLVFDHQLGGGANHYRHALLAGEGYRDRAVLLVTYDVAAAQPIVALRLPDRDDEWLRVPAPNLDLALEQLAAFRIAEVFLNNLYSFEGTLPLLRVLGRLRKGSGAKLRIAAHDHFGICPSYTLLNHLDDFCHVPKSLTTCRNCLAHHKGEFTWLMDVPDIGLWRTVWHHTLQAADEILVFSHSTRTLYRKAYPRLPEGKFTLVPHALDHVRAAPVPVDHAAPLTIGVVGHISVLKGAQVIRNLCEGIVATGANARVVIIGSLQLDYRSPVLTVTGPYVPQDLPRLVAQHGVNLAFFSSICPETFSYVTAELMQLQLPILAFDVGAPAERLADYAGGRIVPLEDRWMVLDHLLRFHAELAAQAAEQSADQAAVTDLNAFRQRAAQKGPHGRGQPPGQSQ